MLFPVAEDEAASAFGERGDHVVADEGGAVLVLDEQAEELVYRRRGGVGESELGLADGELEIDCAGRAFAVCDSVADRSALHGQDLLQPVAAVGRSGEAEEVADGRPPHGGLERERR